MNYDEFDNLSTSKKFFYIWTALENHLSQIREIKWLMRITFGMFGSSFVGFVIWLIKKNIGG